MCCALLPLICVAILSCSREVPLTKEKVTEAVRKIIPVDFEAVSVTPFKQVPGLLQVVVSISNRPVVLYLDTKGKYVVSGSIVELDTKKNLTAETLGAFANSNKGNSTTSAAPAPKVK
jgi:hypothetical protein